jgi:hypothetical protein
MKRQTFVLFEGLAAECRAANPPVLRHHLRTLDHEAEAKTEDDADDDRRFHELGHAAGGARQAENQPDKSRYEAGSVDHCGRERQGLRGLRGRDRARGLHRLHWDGRAVHKPAHQHRQSECKQDVGGVHLENAKVGNEKWDKRAEVAEGARELHTVEAVGNPRWIGFLRHAVI